jgi:hypothetical protein
MLKIWHNLLVNENILKPIKKLISWHKQKIKIVLQITVQDHPGITALQKDHQIHLWKINQECWKNSFLMS